MFVDIENFKSVLAIENLLMPYKKGRLAPDKKSRLPKEHITPQVCMQILKLTLRLVLRVCLNVSTNSHALNN